MVAYAGCTTVEMQQTIRDLQDENRKLEDTNADLLEALEATRARPGHYHGCTHPNTPCNDICLKVQAAIAKARKE